MFERFNDDARLVLRMAQEEVRQLDHNVLGTEHLLLGLFHQGRSFAVDALKSLGVTYEAARGEVKAMRGPGAGGYVMSPPFSSAAKSVLELSLREALQLGHSHIGPEHFLLGLTKETGDLGASVLVKLGGDLPTVHQRVIRILTDAHVLTTVIGDDRGDPPISATRLFARSDVDSFLASWVVADAQVRRTGMGGLVYETCTYSPRELPEISVSVAASRVTRADFESEREPEGTEPIEGLGDAATYTNATHLLRVLAGTTLFTVQVRHDQMPREAAIAVARQALSNVAAQPE